MSFSILEEMRSSWEEFDRLEGCGALAFYQSKTAFQEGKNLTSVYENYVKRCLHKMSKEAKRVLAIHGDANGDRKLELGFLRGVPPSGDESSLDVFANFRARLNEVTTYHQKFNPNGGMPQHLNCEELLEDIKFEIGSVFSQQEKNGNCLDLQPYYTRFLGLSQLKEWRRQTWAERMASKEMQRRKRAKVDHTVIQSDANTRKEPQLSEREIKEKKELMEMHYKNFEDVSYIKFIKTCVDLMMIPTFLESDKETAAFIKDFADHLFETFKKVSPLLYHDQIATEFIHQYEASEDKISWDYFRVKKLHQYLEDQFINTRKYLEMLQSRGAPRLPGGIVSNMAILDQNVDFDYEEEEAIFVGQAESEDEGILIDSDDDTLDPKIYNPSKLPLGWDGKPIPVWLCRLHGLTNEFTCEICGNYSYWGERAFEKHFMEWRHAFGMKCLGVPNSYEYRYITKMEDAQALHQKLLETAEKEDFKPERDVECEDAQGNIMNLKAHNDLRRQGLL